jgi:hypothetical protein
MDGIDEIQAQLVNCFYLSMTGIGRTRKRLLLFTMSLGLMCDGVPPLLRSSYGA